MLFHDEELFNAIKNNAIILNSAKDLSPLIDQISNSKIVMLGESSHGTHEFYNWRRIISKQLITKHGFKFIAVEGDWPPCWMLNQFVRLETTKNAQQILNHFNRWPTWMWANSDVLELATELRTHNGKLKPGERAGFYGLDIYSLFESIDAVLHQLTKISVPLAHRFEERYACFEPFRRDEKAYVRSLIELPEGCEEEVLQNLQELLCLRLDGSIEHEKILFDAQQNARIIAHAEDYYRTMIHGDDSSWNIRDQHMLDTLEILIERFGPNAKGIVWAHNTHIGDYRATDMVHEGLINIGGLARQKWGEKQISLVGFGTHAGEVIASSAWGGSIEKMNVPPAIAQSYEAIFHEVAQSIKQKAFFLTKLNESPSHQILRSVRDHRAIGVVYNPEHEQRGNYVPTSLSNRYDAFIFIDRTTALRPIYQSSDKSELPETWPSGE